MTGVLPFKGIRFGAKDLKDMITEPYDKIPKDLQKKYYERNEHNFIRLNLPADADPYTSARSTLDKWLGSGIMTEDRSPSFYEYSEEFELFGEKRTRRGVFAIVRLEDYEGNNIYRHERTFSGPKADRMNMLRATNTDLEPVFFLYDDTDGEVEKIIESAEKDNCSDFVDESGIRHTVNRFESSRLTDVFRDRKLVIADGHHRYESALAYAKEKKFSGKTGYVMAVLVNKNDPGLAVLSSHRVVRSVSLHPDNLLENLREYFEVEKRGKADVKDPLEDDIVYYYRDHCFSLKPKDGIVSSGSRIDALNVSLLNKFVLSRIHRADDEKNVEFTRWAQDAIARVDEGEAECAFLLRPTDASIVWDVAINGGVMPQKSTDFYPKLVSGLIMFRLS